jgi:hypothetical protein
MAGRKEVYSVGYPHRAGGFSHCVQGGHIPLVIP